MASKRSPQPLSLFSVAHSVWCESVWTGLDRDALVGLLRTNALINRGRRNKRTSGQHSKIFFYRSRRQHSEKNVFGFRRKYEPPCTPHIGRFRTLLLCLWSRHADKHRQRLTIAFALIAQSPQDRGLGARQASV